MYWLGIDIGSIRTDLVLVDENSSVAESLYLKTKSRPVEAVKDGLRRLGKKYVSNDIAGVGVTGSGRYLGSALAGGDVVKNEITSHARAVAQVDPEIRTVIEIGGQDSKIIIMEDGMVSDFAMNTVCAAGTGSFLDRQAGRMGVTIEELGDMAADAEKSVSIAGRCAVFAESDIIHKQQMGIRDGELMAGMCKALAVSYMSNVAKGKKIKPKICFQGGVAANRGMKRAFGAALLAKDKDRGITCFKGFETGSADIELKEIECRGCSNSCTVTRIEACGEAHGYFGDICGKYSFVF